MKKRELQIGDQLVKVPILQGGMGVGVSLSSLAGAVSACGGEAYLRGAESEHMRLVLEVLKQIGTEVIKEDGGIRVAAFGRPKPLDMIKTLPYPGFPTDVQPLLSAALTTADGESRVCETIFDSRFGYAEELKKMGA